MDRQNRINEFINDLEGLSTSIITQSFQISSNYLMELENSIADYIHKNYPAIVFTQDEIKELIEKVYQKKYYNLKKAIDSNIGLLKYRLEDQHINVDEIIEDEINKYKTLFTSVSAGTNISFLGLVDECTQNVMAMLIRKNNSITFAKRIDEVNDYIYKLINDSFLKIMVVLGDHFLDDGILLIEEDFKQNDQGKSKIKTEEFF